MEPQLIDFDQKRFDEATGVLKLFKNIFQGAIDIFNSLNVGKFRKEELKDLILYPEAYVKIKMMEAKDFSLLTDLGLDTSKVIELLKLPEGLTDLTKRIEQINRIFLREKEKSSYLTGEKITEMFHRFYFGADGKLEIKQEFIDQYKKSSETYIQTDEAKKLFAFGTEIISVFEKFKIVVPTKKDLADLVQYSFDTKDGKLVININHISGVEQRATRK